MNKAIDSVLLDTTSQSMDTFMQLRLFNPFVERIPENRISEIFGALSDTELSGSGKKTSGFYPIFRTSVGPLLFLVIKREVLLQNSDIQFKFEMICIKNMCQFQPSDFKEQFDEVIDTDEGRYLAGGAGALTNINY